MTHVWLMGASAGREGVGGYFIPSLDILRLTDKVKGKDDDDSMVCGEALAILDAVETVGTFPMMFHMMPYPDPTWVTAPSVRVHDFTLLKTIYTAKMSRYIARGDVQFDITHAQYNQFKELYSYFKRNCPW